MFKIIETFLQCQSLRLLLHNFTKYNLTITKAFLNAKKEIKQNGMFGEKIKH